ncbi:hypothetical protein [Vulgatibacter sp.]
MASARSLEESFYIFRDLATAARPGFWIALGCAVLTLLVAT